MSDWLWLVVVGLVSAGLEVGVLLALDRYLDSKRGGGGC